MKISRYVIGMLLGMAVLISLTLITGNESDSYRMYDVTVDADDDFYVGAIRNDSDTLILKSQEMQDALALQTDTGLADILGSIMSAGLKAINLIFSTLTMPIRAINSAVGKIFGIPEFFIGIIEAVLIFAIVFTIIRIKVKSDAA